jgi:hypothetical protein
MLTFPIKKKWFDMIASGEKKEEYRDVSPYYNSRLGKHEGTEQDIMLRNGYSDMSPMIQLKAFISRGIGNPKWGALTGKEYWVMKIIEFKVIPAEVFKIKVRRCKRCGRLLIDQKAVKDGYGHICKKKIEASKPDPNQMNLFGPKGIANNIL